MENIALTSEEKILEKNKTKNLLDNKNLNKILDKLKLSAATIIGKIKSVDPELIILSTGLAFFTAAFMAVVAGFVYLLFSLASIFRPIPQERTENQTQIETCDKLKKDNTLSAKEFLSYAEKTNKK